MRMPIGLLLMPVVLLHSLRRPKIQVHRRSMFIAISKSGTDAETSIEQTPCSSFRGSVAQTGQRVQKEANESEKIQWEQTSGQTQSQQHCSRIIVRHCQCAQKNVPYAHTTDTKTLNTPKEVMISQISPPNTQTRK